MRRSSLLVRIAAVCSWTSASLGGEIALEPGSQPGWRPPDGAEQEVLDKVLAVLAESDDGNDEQVFWGLDPEIKNSTNEEEYAAFEDAARKQRGRMTSLHILRVSWKKPQAGADQVGVYAAVDITRTFERAQRDCGAIVLHQAPGDPNWRVLRIDEHSMSDATYDDMARKGQTKQADALWARLRQGCLNAR